MIGEGRTRGQAAILDIAACNNQNSAAIRVSDTPIPTRFVYHWLTFVYEETRRAGAGGNQPALNKERVRAIVLPVPPLAEMEEIVTRVDALLADATLADCAEDRGRLRQSVLHAAFTGRLVPQDPADEPAAALLARLRATPAATRRPRTRRTATQPDLIETPE
jgi:type I restriction enzyme S subunit